MSKLTLPDGAVYESGENVRPLVEKHWDGETVKGVVVKSDDSQRYTLTVAYPVDSPDVGVARDGFQDFASRDQVEKAAWSWMRNGGQVGGFHLEGTEGFGERVESYIYRGPDWHIAAADGSDQVVKEGDWLIGVIWSQDAWNLIKSGEGTGVSMQGGAKRRPASPADVARIKANARR